MATITAEAPGPGKGTAAADRSSAARGGREPDNAGRQLWQVPVFLSGVGLLALVFTGRPFGGSHSLRDVDRELEAARRLIDRSDGDARAAAQHARRALERAGTFPDRRAEALFLLGSAEARLADRAPGLEAADFWKSARSHLEEAERLGVKEQDRGRLQYRLAKTLLYTGEDPQRVIEQLASAVDMADDRAEGYRLLAEAYLRLPEPNLKEALAANEKLRMVFSISPELQALAQLQAGEILVRMGKAEAARKVLEKIGPQAPAGVQAQADVMRARSFQAENQWEKAAALWEKLLKDTRDPLADRGPALYHRGVCLARLGQAPEAKAAEAAWAECLKIGKGDEAVAAALALSEAWLRGDAPEKALEPLARAVEGASAADWKNAFVNLDKACECFEQAVQKYREALKFDLALQCLDLYQHLAVPGRTARLRGDVNADWARARLAVAQKLPPGEARNAETEAARKLLRAAADSYLKTSNQVPGEAREDAVWLASACLLEAGDDRDAVIALNRYLQIGKKHERVGEAWFRLGECYRKDKAPAAQKAAEDSYKNCIQNQSAYGYRSAFAYRARYQLALAMIARGDYDDAETALAQNLKWLREDPDPDTQEKSLFALGGLAFKRKDYRTVYSRLAEALHVDPPLTTPEATRARVQLAESCCHLADEVQRKLAEPAPKTPEESEHFQKEHRRWLLRAADEYFELARFLEAPESAGLLEPEERIQIPFLAAICRFNLGEYDTGLDIYSHLAEQFKNAPMPPPTDEGAARIAKRYPVYRLEALAGVIRCLAALGRGEDLRKRLDELRSVLPTVDASIREEYEKWIIIAAKSLQTP
jgi:TolA-binding protein